MKLNVKSVKPAWTENPENPYDWLVIYDMRPRGHAFFRDGESSRIAIADCSGSYPDQTDDGVLWLDALNPLDVYLDRHNVKFGLRLHREDNRASSSPAGVEEAVWVAEWLGLDLHTLLVKAAK